MVNHRVWNGTEESVVSFPSCISTDAPFWSSCLPAWSFGMGGIPQMISRFWRSMMDCGNDRGRVLRPVLPKACNQTGGGNSLSGRTSMPRSATTKVQTGEGSEPKLEPQKGGYARSREGTVIGSDQRLSHIPRKYGWESTPDCAAKC
jgi:hypothetical protein